MFHGRYAFHAFFFKGHIGLQVSGNYVALHAKAVNGLLPTGNKQEKAIIVLKSMMADLQVIDVQSSNNVFVGHNGLLRSLMTFVLR